MQGGSSPRTVLDAEHTEEISSSSLELVLGCLCHAFVFPLCAISPLLGLCRGCEVCNRATYVPNPRPSPIQAPEDAQQLARAACCWMLLCGTSKSSLDRDHLIHLFTAHSNKNLP